MEGALHLFSSSPSALTPADIYRVADNSMAREHLLGSNIYLITCRPRILIDSNNFCLDGDLFSGFLLVAREGGWHKISFRYRLSFEHHLGNPECCEIAVAVAGTHALVKNKHGQMLIASHLIVSSSECEISDRERDLNVLYVGQGIGKNGKKLAVDRLTRHTTFQRILADFHTDHPEMELLILLFRFEYTRKVMSSGGDMTLTPKATAKEDHAHFQKMEQSSFERKKRITLAEAALINYFQPPYNKTFRKTNFASNKKLKFLKTVLSQGMTGLIVEVGTSNIRSRLCSESRSPNSFDTHVSDQIHELLKSPSCNATSKAAFEQMLDTHIIEIPLTSAEERNSFLHGGLAPIPGHSVPSR